MNEPAQLSEALDAVLREVEAIDALDVDLPPPVDYRIDRIRAIARYKFDVVAKDRNPPAQPEE